MLPDKEAAASGYGRLIDESSEDYLYPDDCFVAVEIPLKVKRAWMAWRIPRGALASRFSAGARVARPGR